MTSLKQIAALLAAGVVCLVFAAEPLGAQQRREILHTPWGEVLDFAPGGAWRPLARRIADYRRALLSAGRIQELNAPMRLRSPAAGTAAAVSGTLQVPAVLFRFLDVGTAAGNDSSVYR